MTDLPPELDAEPEPGFTEHGYRVLEGIPTSGIDERPYQQLGGLARPDAHFGAREFDCPVCEAPKGEKCRVWVERLNEFRTRKMPCIARLRKARDAGLI